MGMRTNRLALCAAMALVVNPCPLRAAPPDGRLDFNRDVRPILSDKCFACHGPDGDARKADLRLDIRDEALKDLGGTFAIVPGKPEQSELVARIFAEDESDRMPPVRTRRTLTEAEKTALRRWIAEGAEYEKHWAFRELPEKVAVPAVRDTAWAHADLDRFILAKLEAGALRPAPPASRERWLRRVTFDLTGLPPTQREINEFLADQSAGAHERVVDRLLASPRYGEQRAVHWLDAARYADSYGYQSDRDTEAWPYRGWVIKAFNQNLPYDQFITDQLAGDLLPDATRDQRVATAFLRVHRKTQEGGSVPEEFRQDGISDRIHTIGTALMGLTMECCRCHDHKYDPITQRDYYSLGAFVNSIDEWGLLHGNGVILPNPVLYLTTPEQDKALAEQTRAIQAAAVKLAETIRGREAIFQQWLDKAAEAFPLPVDLKGSYDLEQAVDGKLRNAANPDEPGTFNAANSFVTGVTGQGIQFTGDDTVSFTHAGAQHMEDPVSVAFWIKPGRLVPQELVFHNSKGFDPNYNGYYLLLEDGRLSWRVVREWPGCCAVVKTREPIAINEWSHVAVTYDGSGKAAGLKVYANGQRVATEVIRDNLSKDSGDGGRIDFGARNRDGGFKSGVVDEIRIYSREITPLEVAQCFDGEALTRALNATQRSDADLAALRTYYFSAIDGEARKAAGNLHQARAAWRKTMDDVRELPVMQEMAQPRPTFILARGEYTQPTEQVARETPGFLPPFPEDQPRNRLGLARWLMSPNHPLTARVAVNRFWTEFFGRGIVLTSENFGTQGDFPSNPELLDWLARDFVASGWDVKRFCRQIVLSATYMQDSRVSPPIRGFDPDNALLTRGPSKRLSAEMLRDNALNLAGLLVEKLGGPSVKPYQAEGSMWKDLNNFVPVYERDKGEGLYRRSMYTWWRRTTQPPNMVIFDAAQREICTARRQLTLTPLQPLVMLNDVQFVEAARVFGERILREGGGSPEQRLSWAFREATARPPTEAEMIELAALYAEQLAYFQKEPERAEKLLLVGDHVADAALPKAELAAASVVASALMNLDACLMLR